MNKPPEIIPHKITKPIQLLAAWLAGLAIVNISFLTAAGFLHQPGWLPPLLVIASIINVPIFIVSLFLLQTKFRPEMQEDTFYSRYLERKYAPINLKVERVDQDEQLSRVAEDIIKKISANTPDKQQQVVKILKQSEVEQLAETYGSSRTLSELFLYYDKWSELHETFREDDAFQHDLLALSNAGLLVIPDGVVRKTILSDMGKAVAEHLNSTKRLWNQLYGRPMPPNNNEAQNKDANNGLQSTSHKVRRA